MNNFEAWLKHSCNWQLLGHIDLGWLTVIGIVAFIIVAAAFDLLGITDKEES